MNTDLENWQESFLSEDGPQESATRHVLLVLSMHMDDYGKASGVSMRDLAVEAGYSEVKASRHVARACSQGWLEKDGNDYMIAEPDSLSIF
jgi:hypothetical protein